MHKNKYLFQNITMSSLPGAGTSTLGKLLADKTGWKYFSGGDFLRAYAIREGLFDPNNKFHHDQSIMGDQADRDMDFMMREKVQDKKFNILDSWLCSFMAQDVPAVLKILLVCKTSVRIDRIVNRDETTVKAAKEHIKERSNNNVTKWNRLYDQEWQQWVVAKNVIGENEDVNYWDPRLYDLVIDTYQFSKEETFQIAYDALVHGVKEKFNVSDEWMKKYETEKYKIG